MIKSLLPCGLDICAHSTSSFSAAAAQSALLHCTGHAITLTPPELEHTSCGRARKMGALCVCGMPLWQQCEAADDGAPGHADTLIVHPEAGIPALLLPDALRHQHPAPAGTPRQLARHAVRWSTQPAIQRRHDPAAMHMQCCSCRECDGISTCATCLMLSGKGREDVGRRNGRHLTYSAGYLSSPLGCLRLRRSVSQSWRARVHPLAAPSAQQA